MSTMTIPIRGMHCKSCEILVEENLKEIPGVHSVHVSLKNRTATINYKGAQPTHSQLVHAVHAAGYELGESERAPWISREPDDYVRLGTALALLLLVYFILKKLEVFDFVVDSGSGSMWVVLVVGLVAGLSSCMALIGGLVLAISARHAELHPEATTAQKFKPHIFFNAGRILGYALFGGLIGFLGSAFQLSGTVLGVLTMLVGFVMIFLGLKLIEVFPALTYKTLTLPKSLARFLGIKAEVKEYSHKSSFVAGALTFFLPCGFTQAMQLYAISTGNFADGALIMSLFALGTAPGLLGIGGLSSIFKGEKARTFFMAAGLAVIVLGAVNISNASRLISWPTQTEPTTTVSTGDVQIVRMTQNERGYSPTQLTVEVGRPVRWIVTSTSQFTCASSLVMREYGIQRALKPGENIIEFTPIRTGKIDFSCAMGMYRGYFNVIAGSATTSTGIDVQNVIDTAENATSPEAYAPEATVRSIASPNSNNGLLSTRHGVQNDYAT